MEVVSQEGYRVFRPTDAQAHDGILQNLLDVVALHVRLALPQRLLLLGVGRHLQGLAGRCGEKYLLAEIRRTGGMHVRKTY